MYKVFKDEERQVPTLQERVDFLNTLKINEAFDLPFEDHKYIRAAMGRCQDSTKKRFTCYLLDDRKHYRCKRIQ